MLSWRAVSDDDVEAFVGIVAARLDQIVPRPGLGIVVALDGPAGSGKTSLAARLAARTTTARAPATVVHMDDLYEGWQGLDLGPEPRMLAQILEPLAAGRPAHWQRYDWFQGMFSDWHDIPAVSDSRRLIVLEGCGSGALAYEPYLDVLIWVEAGRSTRVSRGLRRDGAAVQPRWQAWMETEERHFAANRTRERADVLLDTDALRELDA